MTWAKESFYLAAWVELRLLLEYGELGESHFISAMTG